MVNRCTSIIIVLILPVTNELFIRVLLKNHNIANNYRTNVMEDCDFVVKRFFIIIK